MKWFRGLYRAVLCFSSPLIAAAALICVGLGDLWFAIAGKKQARTEGRARNDEASIVIPNWNGKDLLEKYLPSVVAAVLRHPGSEIIVVDNASTDGSAEYVEANFPEVRVLRLPENLGFGGGSNAGFREAKNDIVVLLNNDMRVEPGFLAPLLQPFSDPLVFSVSAQIFLSDPQRRREETGLTETWWEGGRMLVSHRADPEITESFPCAYPGGGSSAFDRRKFLELGGFDDLFHPFYYEDTDLGLLAWKRGWKVLYAPTSVVFHEHRGTIGKKFSPEFINATVKRNALLYTWKNVHDWGMLTGSFAAAAVYGFFSPFARGAEARAAGPGLAAAIGRLGPLLKSRARARALATVKDTEALRRQKGGYFRDRFEAALTPVPKRLQVLFLSPYAIEPPLHGGAVFMRHILRAAGKLADIHLLSFVDFADQIPPHAELAPFCASTQFRVRRHALPRHVSQLLPRVVHEFADREFEWQMHRTIFLHKIDAVQIDYTMMAQYSGGYERIPCFLFEHDIAFQSLGRRISSERTRPSALAAYLQLLHYELTMLPRFNRVQVCSRENGDYLLSYLPELKGRIDAESRAVIDVEAYSFTDGGREPNTVLFVGSFNHLPNQHALAWFIDDVLPVILKRNPAMRFIIAGTGSTSKLGTRLQHPAITVAGAVPDIGEVFEKYSVLICPIRSGSGVRVKLLEAFASGIPVVSTLLGAEGLTRVDGEVCRLADDTAGFANALLALLEKPAEASAMARRARQFVAAERNSKIGAMKLVESYRGEISKHRPTNENSAETEVEIGTWAASK